MNTFKQFLPAIAWAGIIFWLSVTPGIQLPETIVAPDKIGHLLAYGILGWLTLWALRSSGSWSGKNALLASATVAIYGASLEFVQWKFFPFRFFEIGDMLANAAGAAISLFIFSKKQA